VLSIQPKSNTVVVGSAAELEVDLVRATMPVWTSAEPGLPFDCLVQMRAHGMVSEASIELTQQGDLVARLAEPQRGVAAGQALVMYDGDRVIGSATISAAERATAVSR
jgi:tRNA-specific 2-thiouridylase